MLKWPQYPKESIDLTQSLTKYSRHFSQNYKKQSSNLYGTTKGSELPKLSWRKRTKLEVSPVLSSNCTTKVLQCDTGIKHRHKDQQKIIQSLGKNPHAPMVNWSISMEARIYNE